MLLMKNFQIFNTRDVKQLLSVLKVQFSYEDKLDYVFLLTPKDRLYAVDRDVFDFELNRLRIDTLGLYFGTYIDNKLRLSIEGSQIIGPKCNKNILELDAEEMKQWMKGIDIDKNNAEGLYLIKHEEDFLGTGKIVKGKLYNYVPKTRRVLTNW